MIVRLWRGRTTYAQAGAYRRHVEEALLGRLRAVPGHESAYLLRQDRGGSVEMLLLTTWESMEAVCAFAGGGATAPEAASRLTGATASVEHFEVVPAQG